MLDTDCDSYMDMLLGRLEHVMLCTGVNIDIWNLQVSGSKIFFVNTVYSGAFNTFKCLYNYYYCAFTNCFLPYKFETLPVLNANCLFSSQLASAPCYLCL